MGMQKLIILRRNKIISFKNLPKFIRLDGTCLRLITDDDDHHRDTYWRDGGLWGVDVNIKNGKLYSKTFHEPLNNIEMFPVSKVEWRESNGRYAPTDI